MNPPQPIADRLELARTIAREAGRLTLDFFGKADLAVERKLDDSPVTAADRGAEALLRERIEAAFPDDAILGEELGERPGTSPYRWVLDPIDGTKSFITGVPLYTTLVGLLERTPEGERSVAGVIYAPAIDERLYAATGGGAWHQIGSAPATAAAVSSVDKLSDAVFLTSEVRSFTSDRSPDALGVYLELQNGARLSRTWGDAYGYMLVATGRAEVMVDPVLCLWDTAALQPILEEAGGTFTDW
ncbi:unnamed protein product, partial [marine sediment metagenome]